MTAPPTKGRSSTAFDAYGLINNARTHAVHFRKTGLLAADNIRHNLFALCFCA